MPFAPNFDPLYTRVDNGLYLANYGEFGLRLKRARDIHVNDPSALSHLYNEHMPPDTKMRVYHYLKNVQYTLYRGSHAIFRAEYAMEADELVNVRTAVSERRKGIARACIAAILRIDGPSIIRAGPSPDSPISYVKLKNFYSSFPGYHAIAGSNKVLRLMQDTQIEEAQDLDGVEIAGVTTVRRKKSNLELSVLEQNSRELKRVMDILQPINDEEVNRLLDNQATDLLSIRNSMALYNAEFFAGRPWGRAHRVMFAQGMADKLLKYAGQRYGVWETIIANESY